MPPTEAAFFRFENMLLILSVIELLRRGSLTARMEGMIGFLLTPPSILTFGPSKRFDRGGKYAELEVSVVINWIVVERFGGMASCKCPLVRFFVSVSIYLKT